MYISPTWQHISGDCSVTLAKASNRCRRTYFIFSHGNQHYQWVARRASYHCHFVLPSGIVTIYIDKASQVVSGKNPATEWHKYTKYYRGIRVWTTKDFRLHWIFLKNVHVDIKSGKESDYVTGRSDSSSLVTTNLMCNGLGGWKI